MITGGKAVAAVGYLSHRGSLAMVSPPSYPVILTKPAALLGGLELGYRLTPRRETGREEPLVPVAHHDAPAVARELSARSWA